MNLQHHDPNDIIRRAEVVFPVGFVLPETLLLPRRRGADVEV